MPLLRRQRGIVLEVSDNRVVKFPAIRRTRLISAGCARKAIRARKLLPNPDAWSVLIAETTEAPNKKPSDEAIRETGHKPRSIMYQLLNKRAHLLIVPSDSKKTLTTVKQLNDDAIKHIAIGQPESVPAGQYAKETLTARNVWDILQNKLVFAKDVEI